MTGVEEAVQKSVNARMLAQTFLSEYFHERQATYPLNPFQMLKDLGIPFVFRAFNNYEGVYLPAKDSDDIPVVGINIKRPITRQRYTAAHELCHHIKDKENNLLCEINNRNPIEKYAEQFAAELLMPLSELKRQVSHYAPTGYVSFDDVLRISEYFGVSFLACLQRIAFDLKKIEGPISSDKLKRKTKKYKPDKCREEMGFNHLVLYKQVIDSSESFLHFNSSDFIKAKYCNNYIYNDSRLEGVDIDLEKVAEIVTDIRLNASKSEFCNEKNKAEVEIAGHANMYNYIFDTGVKQKISIYTTMILHGKLYSCAPEPAYGGKFRTNNPLVIGAKFETIDYSMVPSEMAKLNQEAEAIFKEKNNMSLSQYVEHIARLHHRLTVIHPFGDGNGRSSRGLLNLFLLHREIIPIYIKVEEKDKYLSALMTADETGDYTKLYIVLFQALMRAQVELTEAPLSNMI